MSKVALVGSIFANMIAVMIAIMAWKRIDYIAYSILVSTTLAINIAVLRHSVSLWGRENRHSEDMNWFIIRSGLLSWLLLGPILGMISIIRM
jgi:hypothetical protein